MVCTQYGTTECEEYLKRLRDGRTFNLLGEKDSEELVTWAKRTTTAAFGGGVLHVELILMMLTPKASSPMDIHVQVLCAWAILSHHLSTKTDPFARSFKVEVTRRAMVFSDFVRYHIVKYLHRRRIILDARIES